MRRLLASLLLLVPALASATTYYAAAGGGTATGCTNAGADVCTAARAVTTAGDGDTIIFAAGTYPASELHATVGYLLVTGENLTLTCSGSAGSCILQPSAGSAVSGIRFNSPTTTAMTVTGFTVDTSVAANGISECFYSTDGAAQYALTWASNTCSGAVTNYAFRNTANEITLTLTGNTFTSPASATPASFLFSATTITTGSITATGNSGTILNTPTTSGGFNLYNVRPAANGITFSASDDNFSITLGSTASANVAYGYRIRNLLGTNISDNTLTITRATDSALQMVAISCGSDAAVSSAGCVIDGNTIYHGAANGQAIQIQSDATGTGDGQATLAVVKHNRVYCTVDNTLTHGLLIGYTVGGRAYGNFFQNCGYGAISKVQTSGAATFTGNIVNGCWAYAYYSKGSDGAVFANNAAAVTNTACTPMASLVEGATNSVNSVFKNNLFIANGAAPADIYTGAASQTATFDANDYYGFASLTFTYDGNDVASLTAWNALANVGTDLSVDPSLVCSTYSNPACFGTQGASVLRRAGAYISPQNRDYRGRPAWMPPDIGAYQASSGDEAAARTARTIE